MLYELFVAYLLDGSVFIATLYDTIDALPAAYDDFVDRTSNAGEYELIDADLSFANGCDPDPVDPPFLF